MPTYAFQHRRYWLEAGSGSGDVTAVQGEIDIAFWQAIDNADMATLGVDPGQPIGDVLPVLSAWRQRQRQRSVTDSWRYRIGWKPLTAEPARLSGTWLLVASDTVEIDQRLTEIMTRSGARVRWANVALDQTDRDKFSAELTAEIVASGISGVLSLLALDDQPSAHTSAVSRGVYGNVLLLQVLNALEVAVPVWCVTSGAVSVGASDRLRNVVQAQMWGLGQVAGLEFPQWWGGLIDLPVEWDPSVLQQLCSALSRRDGEDQLAVRVSGTLGRRMLRAPGRAGESQLWSPRGTVLITGGTGGIGAHLARWAAGNGAEHLVLVSRHGPAAPAASELQQELQSLGAQVTILAADMSNREDVAEVLAVIDSGDIALRAVIHAAGVAADTGIPEIGPASLQTVTAAKVRGAQNLDQLLGERSLDAFVLFSSGAATWGSGLLAGYAAANAHLDALAHDRRARGLAATSLAWGGWSGGGMAAVNDSGDYLDRMGVRLMDPELAIHALSHAVGGEETQLTIADIDWTVFTPIYTMARQRPLIEQIPEAYAAQETDISTQTNHSLLRQRLNGLSRPEQLHVVLELVRTQVALVLGH
ncbi:SDR family NAD(P)-dependent oxidoreductase, partial [Nocardia sp. NPDC050697]|uniref:SDR family NAD(P)-dependent oxidoreductase n=1 Tax=Nocardia sp. NPDC050697 TaxID=3155158 RepID=UPI0033E61CD0